LIKFQLNALMTSHFYSFICFLAFANMAIAAPSLVKTQTLAELLIERQFTSPATAIAINQSQISAELSARITQINVRVGDLVEAGDILIKLDCRNYDNALVSTEAQNQSLQVQLKLAQQQLKRAQTLQNAGNIAADILDQRVAEVDIVQASLKFQLVAIADAELSVQRCLIRSPYRAEITQRLVGEGTLATPGLPLVEIIGLDNVELSVQIPVDLADSVLNAKSLIFATNKQNLKAKIRIMSRIVNSVSGNRELRLTPEAIVAPGVSGRLEWYSEPMLPASLLSRRNEMLGVFVAVLTVQKADQASDHAVARFVELKSALEGRPSPIELPITTQIIVEGRHQLSSGDAIKLVSTK
jgi:RND family efflux transporter MFP subunit